tara:strand:+ start:269 stop:403 length:135 start_codon:yes stop_codon:yes gene_type:complete
MTESVRRWKSTTTGRKNIEVKVEKPKKTTKKSKEPQSLGEALTQ